MNILAIYMQISSQRSKDIIQSYIFEWFSLLICWNYQVFIFKTWNFRILWGFMRKNYFNKCNIVHNEIFLAVCTYEMLSTNTEKEGTKRVIFPGLWNTTSWTHKIWFRKKAVNMAELAYFHSKVQVKSAQTPPKYRNVIAP